MVGLFFFSSCASTIITPVGNFSYEPNLSAVIAFDNQIEPIGIGVDRSVLLTGQDIYKNADSNIKNIGKIASSFLPEEEIEINQTLTANNVDEHLPQVNQTLWRQNELTLLTMCIYGESRSESYEGKLAIGYVVMNRLHERKWFGKTLREVILKPYQFSCFNRNDPNYRKLFKPKARYWKECFKAAWNAYSKLGEDPTDGSNHYCRYNITPRWIHKMDQKKRIGNHIFFSSSSTASIDQWYAFLNDNNNMELLKNDKNLQQELIKTCALLVDQNENHNRYVNHNNQMFVNWVQRRFQFDQLSSLLDI
jgi:cell wall hydrolase